MATEISHPTPGADDLGDFIARTLLTERLRQRGHRPPFCLGPSGWTALYAREVAADHVALDKALGTNWTCGCVYCALTRRNLALMAMARVDLAIALAAETP